MMDERQTQRFTHITKFLALSLERSFLKECLSPSRFDLALAPSVRNTDPLRTIDIGLSARTFAPRRWPSMATLEFNASMK